MSRPLGKHVDNEELNALVPSPSETALELAGLSSEAIRQAQNHVASCGECSGKVRKYWLLVNRCSVANSEAAPPGVDCPAYVDWCEVAAGLWPELKAAQLIKHAALCEHCGPLLRVATRLGAQPTPQKEKLLAKSKSPSRPDAATVERSAPWGFAKWIVPGLALLVLVGVLATRKPSAPPLSGPEFAEFAVDTHRQHQQGSLALEVRSDSQQVLNEWFKTKASFSLALPVSQPAPGEKPPYRLEGARLVQVAGHTAAFIAYQRQTLPLTTAGLPMSTVSITVVPDSLAVASGGIEVDSNKLQFHYALVKRYKVVTWSVHGLTYALVSQEVTNSQQSCLVCHSGMSDRNLGHIPTALPTAENPIEPVLQ